MSRAAAAVSLVLASLPAAGPVAPTIAPANEGRAYVVVTHADVGFDGRLTFALSSMRLVSRMAGTPGLIAQRQGIRRLGAEVWTATAWESPEAMKDFVRSAAHAAAMRESAFAITRMTTHHLDCERDRATLEWRDVRGLAVGRVPEGCVVRKPTNHAPA